jgi:hypothetical protein
MAYRVYAAALSLVLFAFVIDRQAIAQTPPATRIPLSEIITIPHGTESALPIALGPSADIPKRAMVLIEGVPGSFQTTGGRIFESGVWGVPAAELPKARLTAPAEAAGTERQVRLTVVTFDGQVLLERRVTLAVAAAAKPLPSSPAAGDLRGTAVDLGTSIPLDDTSPSPPRAASEPALQIPVAEEAERLKSGQAALDLDDIAAARLVYEYLATHGSAAGAYKLAQTYDAGALARLSAGALIQPDAALAASWYEKAAAMGHEGAREALARGR